MGSGLRRQVLLGVWGLGSPKRGYPAHGLGCDPVTRSIEPSSSGFGFSGERFRFVL